MPTLLENDDVLVTMDSQRPELKVPAFTPKMALSNKSAQSESYL
jgi:hypothetical protein